MTFRRAQSRSASFIEAGANVLVGYLVAIAVQQVVFPLFGIQTTLAQDSAIAAAFTAVSVARSYLLRRIFERIGTGRRNAQARLAGAHWRGPARDSHARPQA